MKRLRHIFVIISVLTSINLSAVESSGAPTFGFQSTSTMTSTGSGVASAAATGGVFASSMTTGKPLTYKISGPRREVGDEEEPADDPDPNKPANPFPIGDGVWVMIVAAAVYIMKKTTKKAKIFAHSKYM